MIVERPVVEVEICPGTYRRPEATDVHGRMGECPSCRSLVALKVNVGVPMVDRHGAPKRAPGGVDCRQ